MPWSYLQSFSFKIKWCLKWIEKRWVINDGCVTTKKGHPSTFNHFGHMVPQYPMDWGALLGEADRKLLMFFIKAVETSHREQDQNPPCIAKWWYNSTFHISWRYSVAAIWEQVRKHEKVLVVGLPWVHPTKWQQWFYLIVLFVDITFDFCWAVATSLDHGCALLLLFLC